MSTPQAHIDDMKSIAKQIQDLDFVQSCYVDDWGRYSNFQLVLFVEPAVFNTTNKGVLTRRIQSRFNALLKGTGAHLRNVYSPTAQYRVHPGSERRQVCGYDRKYWMIEVDYQHYDSHSNTFS